MLKKFMRSKVFVLSMLVASVGSDAKGMDPTDIRYFLNNTQDQTRLSVLPIIDDSNTSANEKAIFDQPENPAFYPLLPCTYDSNIFVFQTNVNPEMPSNISANHPVRNPRYYPKNWYSSGAGQFFEKHPEYNKCFDLLYHFYAQLLKVGMPKYILTINKSDGTSEVRKKIADNWNGIAAYADLVIQTNPQTQKVRQAPYPEDWAGSAAEKFCKDHGLTDKDKIRSFVANAKTIDYAMQAVPNYAIEVRRVFMNKVYPVLATLSEEEIQEIFNVCQAKSESSILNKEAILNQWKKSKIGSFCEKNKIKFVDLVALCKRVATNCRLIEPSREELRNKVSLISWILNNEQAINRVLQLH